MAVRRLAEVQPESFAFSPGNRAWAEREIAKFPEGRQASAVIALLWRAQEQEGWVTKPAIESVAEMLGMPTIRVLEVATFYTMFHLEPVGETAHVQVCGTTPCMLRGAGDIIEICRKRIHAQPHHRSADGAFSWEEVECLGACVNAPMVQISKDTYEDLTPASFEALLDAFEHGETPRPGPQNGRQYSMPVTGSTSLTDIEYADDDVPHARARSNGTAAKLPHSAADTDELEPHTAVNDIAGGEDFEAERLRRKGGVPSQAGGTDPAAGETAEQEVAHPDASGRSDEAASRAMGARAEGRKTRKSARDQAPKSRSGIDRKAQPRTDRDLGDKDS